MGKECCGNDEDHVEELAWETADYTQKKYLVALHPVEYARFVEEFKEAFKAGKTPREALVAAFKTID
jgi:hypothetical protein